MLVLEGLKVIDLSNYVPGAFCTMILADFGAEVVKIEPVKPFPFENMGYSSSGEEKRKSAAFFALNRNKKSVAIDLKSDSGRQIFYRLARQADVIIEGYRPGVVKNLGIDYGTIKDINPRIIYCSLSGYGQNGPYSLYPGHDINYISIAGVLGAIGHVDGPPAVPLNLIADFAGASLYGAIAILLACIARGKTGRGQYIDHAYLDGALHLMTYFTQQYFLDGTSIARGESWFVGVYPYYAVYRTKDDKYLSIGCLEPQFWQNLCQALGREDYAALGWKMDTTYKKPTAEHEKMFDFLTKTFLGKTRDEWFDLLAPRDIPVGKVYSMDEVFTDPHVVFRKTAIEVHDQKLGRIKQMGVLPRLSETPGTVRTLAPLHGDHTEDILRELGYSKDEIDHYRKNSIIG